MSNIYDLDNKCLIAIPKKGRLCEKILPILEAADVQFVRKQRLDIALCSNFYGAGMVFLPAHDVGLYTSLGRVDMGITGLDIIEETNSEVTVLAKLGFGKCRLSVQVPVDSPIKTAKDLVGKRIATSFPNITKKFFSSLNKEVATSVETVSGSVEVACALGLADGIVDLVESGDTMRAAGLHEIHTIMESEAAFVVNPHSKHKDIANILSTRIQGVLTALNYVMVEYNIERAKFPEAKKIAPGKTSPTIMPLDDPNWIAVKVMVRKDNSNKVLDELQAVGATDIVVTVLKNFR